MRTRLFAAAIAAATLATLPAIATLGSRSASTDPPAPPADVAARLTSADRDGAPAPTDAWLTRRLATAGPDDVIEVLVHGDDLSAALAAVAGARLDVLGTLPAVGVTLTAATPAGIAALAAAPGVAYLEGNRPITFDLDTSHVATRGREARTFFLPQDGGTTPATVPPWCKPQNPQRHGRPCPEPEAPAPSFPGEIDGTGVGIAIVDSGVDAGHPFFLRDPADPASTKVKRNLRVVRHAVPCVVFATEPIAPAPCLDGSDQVVDAGYQAVDMPVADSEVPGAGGHGTHVAGIAGGLDTDALGTTLHGAAPDADLYAFAMGNGAGIYDANIALQWILDNHAEPCGEGVPAADCPPIRVINNSYGAVVVGDEYDPNSSTAKLQDQLVAAGVTMVWAAGNGDAVNDGGNGSDVRTNAESQSPTPGILSVANYDDQNSGTRDGALAPSSSRGLKTKPATWPDIAAPGTGITSSCRRTLDCGASADDPNWGTISGTSMAAPHVTGIVAQLLEVRPTLTPGQIEDLLEDTAYQFTFGAPYSSDLADRNADHTTSYDKGHGLVDVKAAVAELLGVTLDGDAVPPACAANPIAVDVEGDGASSSTDLVSAAVDPGPTADSLRFTFSVADLLDEYPQGTTGFMWELNFAVGGTDVFVGARRSQIDGVPPATDAQSFVIGRDRATLETLASGLAGTVDSAGDVITITLTQADIDRANAAIEAANAEPGATVEPTIPALASLPLLSQFELTSHQSTYLVAGNLLQQADVAGGTCAYKVGTGVVPNTTTGDTGGGTTSPPDPSEYDDAIDPGEQVAWEGTATVPVYPTASLGGCVGPADPLCSNHRLWVSAAGTLRIEVSFDAGDDWDIYLYGPDGTTPVDDSASAANPEVVEFTVPGPGVYTLSALPFAAPSGTHHAVATLT